MKHAVELGGHVMKKRMGLIVFLLCLVGTAPVRADDTSMSEDEVLSYRKREFLNLTLGIEQDVKLPPLPSEIEFKGDFRKITGAAHSRELGILRFTPRAEGFATLTIHNKRDGKIVAEFRIDVKKSQLDKVVREMRGLLGDIEGINIKVVNNRVVVDGQVLLPKDLGRIHAVVFQFGDKASTLVTLSPLAQKKIAEFISRDINNPEIEVQAINEKIILRGYASDEEEKVRAEIIAKTYLPDMVVDAAEEKGVIKKRKALNDGVINLIQVKSAAPAPPEKMIQLVLHFVELNKEYGKSFKFQFTPELSDQSGLQFSTGQNGGGVVSQITGVVSNLLPKLNWAKSHGHARILESTSLIVENNKTGVLNQLTDFPVPVPGANGGPSTLTSVKVGLQSMIKPTLLGEKSGSVKMDIKFKVGNIVDYSAGFPVTSNDEMETVVTVRDRQSAAIGGLIRNQSTTGYNPPNGAKNPIITLYASKEFRRKQSQFVVFVTPVVKTSASAGSEQVKKKFRLHD